MGWMNVFSGAIDVCVGGKYLFALTLTLLFVTDDSELGVAQQSSHGGAGFPHRGD